MQILSVLGSEFFPFSFEVDPFSEKIYVQEKKKKKKKGGSHIISIENLPCVSCLLKILKDQKNWLWAVRMLTVWSGSARFAYVQR